MIRGATLYAPRFLTLELCGVALKKIKLYRELATAILGALDLALSFDINFVESVPRAVMRIALDSNLSIYDATYRHASQILGCPLVTLDRRLAAAAKRLTLA